MNNLDKKTLCTISIFMAILDINAQASGKIYDRQTLQPLIGATVVIKNTDKGTTSDENVIFSIQVKSGDFLPVSYLGYEKQFIKDIIYLEADSNYTTFHMKDGSKVVSSKSLKEYEFIMEQNNFFRSHHSHIVNLSCVTSYSKTSGDQITMSNGVKLDLSRRKKQAFLESMSKEV